MPTKKIQSKPTSRFLVLNVNCQNVEDDFSTLEEAQQDVTHRINYDEVDEETLRILEVIKVYRVGTLTVNLDQTDLTDVH